MLLTLKVGGLHRPEHSERVERLRALARTSGLTIQFDDRHPPRADMLPLVAEADCYVSFRRAEGFGYTMAGAMYYGVPVIASGYSGNLEFMTEDNSYLVPCREAYVRRQTARFSAVRFGPSQRSTRQPRSCGILLRSRAGARDWRKGAGGRDPKRA